MVREIQERLQVDQPMLARLRAADVIPGRIVLIGVLGNEGDGVRVCPVDCRLLAAPLRRRTPPRVVTAHHELDALTTDLAPGE